MQQEPYDKTLINDKALADALFNKEALNAFDVKLSHTPADYFENFEEKIVALVMRKKSSTILFNFSRFGKIAIAASFLTIATAAYLFISPNYNTKKMAINVEIQDIPTAEIDDYVNSNELVAEIDWQEEINIEATSLEKLNTHLIKDSNHIE